jgi:hypothetical protein
VSSLLSSELWRLVGCMRRAPCSVAAFPGFACFFSFVLLGWFFFGSLALRVPFVCWLLLGVGFVRRRSRRVPPFLVACSLSLCFCFLCLRPRLRLSRVGRLVVLLVCLRSWPAPRLLSRFLLFPCVAFCQCRVCLAVPPRGRLVVVSLCLWCSCALLGFFFSPRCWWPPLAGVEWPPCGSTCRPIRVRQPRLGPPARHGRRRLAPARSATPRVGSPQPTRPSRPVRLAVWTQFSRARRTCPSLSLAAWPRTVPPRQPPPLAAALAPAARRALLYSVCPANASGARRARPHRAGGARGCCRVMIPRTLLPAVIPRRRMRLSRPALRRVIARPRLGLRHRPRLRRRPCTRALTLQPASRL